MTVAEPPALGGVDPARLRIDHEVAVDPRNGRVGVRVPLDGASGRCGFGPRLALRYDSSGANGVWGTGWSLDGLPSISVSTRLHDPSYDARDGYASTVAGELVPALIQRGDQWVPKVGTPAGFTVRYWRARRESTQLRVEQWTATGTGRTHWRTRDAEGTLTVYGLDDIARVVDPADATRVHSWLAQAQYDTHGNAIRFDYAAETLDGVDTTTTFERSRSAAPALAQRYLTRIRYGNSLPVTADAPEPAALRWHFQFVVDYGDHPGDGPEPDRAWPARPDATSTYRTGFEVRTYRLARRVLAFHDFTPLGPTPVLVGAYRLEHDSQATGSTLRTIGYTGFGAAGAHRDLPPLRLTYTEPAPDTAFTDAPGEATVNTPGGLGTGHRWIDLYGEGLAGILTETAAAWYYKSNEGGGRFGPQTLVAERPAYRLAEVALADFDADGNPNLAVLHGRAGGYYTFDRDTQTWLGFQPFGALPHLEAAGRRAQWLDVNGDGMAELLLADAERITWYPSLGTAGFGAPVTARLPDATTGVGEDPNLNHFFADMTGDGAADQVLVRNGRVQYWPQLGNGRFGPPVLMQDAPVFAADHEFDASRLLLVDLDGDGAADLVYLGHDGIRWWRNVSGNAFADGGLLAPGVVLDNLSTVAVLDFLGEGTPCLVWSSPLPGTPDELRYARLTGGVRPHLLLRLDNGSGTAHLLRYASSATAYLQDRAAGRPWRTRLPVHHPVVTRHEVADLIGGTSAATVYAYHDGHYDAAERLMVFGAVDTSDADLPGAADPVAETAPGCLRTWYHTGVDRYGPAGSRFPAAYGGDPLAAWLAPHTVAGVADLASGDYEHAVAAPAGSVLRQELFTVTDSGALAPHPLHVTQYSYRVDRRQPGQGGRDPVFQVHLSERLTHRYEQVPDDPRVNHDLVLAVDAYGVPTTSVAVVYPRRPGRPGTLPEQLRLLADLTVARHLHVDTGDRYELTVPVERIEYELAGVVPAGAVFDTAELAALVTAALATPLPAGAALPAGPAARLTGWRRHLYWNDDRTAALLPGQVGSGTLVHHTESAVFNPAQLAGAFTGSPGGMNAVGDAALTAAGYTAHDGYWWRAEPVCHYRDADGFHLPDRTVRADGATTVLGYDSANLTTIRITDAFGAATVSEVDYRQLTPVRVTDPNGAVVEVLLDPLGVAVATTSYGTVGGRPYGQEPLAGFQPPADGSVDAALADPAGRVRTAATYVAYELGWTSGGPPPRTVLLVREGLAHDGSGAAPAPSPVGVRVTHHDGLGRPLQTKDLVAPGLALTATGPGGAPAEAFAAQRWRASGHIRFNRKQEPVRAYDPFYAATADYDGAPALATYGAVAVTSYDASGRTVRMDLPDGTHIGTAYAAWSTTVADQNDTVLDSGYRLLREHLPADDPERDAYDKAAAHANTPVVSHLDPAGQVVREVHVAAAGGADQVITVRRDGNGAELELLDGRGVTTHRFVRDLAGRPLRDDSADAGTCWSLPDAYDRLTDGWNELGVHIRQTYDVADRLVAVDVDGIGSTRRVEHIVYGDDPAVTDAAARNAVGRPVLHRDQAGTLTFEGYTPGGLAVRTVRRLCSGVDGEPDWRQPVPLEAEEWVTEVELDALGRLRAQRLPDGSSRTSTYLPGGGLAAVTMSTVDGKVAGLTVFDGVEVTARGQRRHLRLGNGVEVAHTFDRETSRATAITANRGAVTLQDLRYTYDPVGNVVRVEDLIQRAGGPVLPGITVTPEAVYTYDEFYRLVGAGGRVHQSLLEHDYRPGGAQNTRHLSFNNAAAVERYQRSYRYDAAGNLIQVKHQGASQQWTTDLLVAAGSNRSVPALDPAGNPVTNPDGHFDAAGNCVSLAHLRTLAWNYRNGMARAVVIDRTGTGQPDDDERYVYDHAGMRVRKVARRLVSGAVEETEKLYLGGCEIVRVRAAGTVVLERITSHVADERTVLAYVHRWTSDTAARDTDDVAVMRVRYPLTDHLGSAQLELDQAGAVIAYEEYFPYGGTSFVAGDAIREVRLRDYRFCGKECDDATGLYAFGHRYYAPWLGRWLSPDPEGPNEDLNRYRYVRNNPINLIDPDGLQATGTVQNYTTASIPPEWGVPLTPREIDQFNHGELFLLRRRGSDVVEKVSRKDAMAFLATEVKEGRDATFGHVTGHKPKKHPPKKKEEEHPPPPTPDTVVTVDGGEPDVGGGLGEAPEGKTGAGGGKGDAGTANLPDGAEHGADGTGGGAKGAPDGSGAGEKGNADAHHDGAGGDGKHSTGDGKQGAGTGKQGTGVGTGKQGTGAAQGDDAVKHHGTGTGGKVGGAGNQPGKGKPGGRPGGEPGGLPAGDVGGVSGGLIGGDVGGDLQGRIGGSVDGTLDGHTYGGDNGPSNRTAPPGQTANGQDQRGGRGAGGTAAAPGNGRAQGTGNHPGSGAGGGQRGEHPGGTATGSQDSVGAQPGSGGGAGAGKPPDGWDRAVKVAGFFDLQFGNDEGGASGGIPGGAGFLKGRVWQALYVAVVAVSLIYGAVKLVAKVGVTAALLSVKSVIGAVFTKRFWREVIRHEAFLLTREFWSTLPRRIGRFFWDGRTFNAIQKEYWRHRSGATQFSQQLHHWLLPNKWSWVPQGLRNAGFNLFATHKWINNIIDRKFTRWTANWFASRTGKYIIVPGFLANVGYESWNLGDRIGRWITGRSDSAPANPRTPQASPSP